MWAIPGKHSCVIDVRPIGGHAAGCLTHAGGNLYDACAARMSTAAQKDGPTSRPGQVTKGGYHRRPRGPKAAT